MNVNQILVFKKLVSIKSTVTFALVMLVKPEKVVLQATYTVIFL